MSFHRIRMINFKSIFQTSMSAHISDQTSIQKTKPFCLLLKLFYNKFYLTHFSSDLLLTSVADTWKWKPRNCWISKPRIKYKNRKKITSTKISQIFPCDKNPRNSSLVILGSWDFSRQSNFTFSAYNNLIKALSVQKQRFLAQKEW